MRKYTSLFVLGALNIIHALFHLLQVIQSVFMATYAFGSKKLEDTFFHKLMESPWMGLVWLAAGAMTLYLGVRDYKHHKHHKD